MRFFFPVLSLFPPSVCVWVLFPLQNAYCFFPLGGTPREFTPHESFVLLQLTARSLPSFPFFYRLRLFIFVFFPLSPFSFGVKTSAQIESVFPSFDVCFSLRFESLNLDEVVGVDQNFFPPFFFPNLRPQPFLT